MRIFTNNVLLLAKRILFLLVVYGFCRLYFLLCNLSTFSPFDFAELAKSFWYGVRFDFSAILFLNIAFYVFHFLPFAFVENQRYQSVLRHSVIFVNMLGVALNLIDTGYFEFQNGRSGVDFIENMLLSDDTANLLPQYVRDYWYHFVVFAALYVACELWFPRYKQSKWEISGFQRGWVNGVVATLVAVVFVAASFIFYRGLGVKPLGVVDAMQFTQNYAPITLNTPFTILRTAGGKGVKLRSYFTDEMCERLYSARKNMKHTNSEFTKKNVVILILEGMSQRSVGFFNPDEGGYTPVLDSILAHSYTFPNAFANGNKSIQAIPAILSSVPQLMDETVIGSKYAANKTDALPRLLNAKGYHTAFFHGAFNGSMGFDKYCKSIGFAEYYGMDEFLEENDAEGNYDSDWGIFDDRFLEYTKETLDDFPEPFLASIFTISSHHPYVVPEEYKDMFHEKRQEMNAMRYADFSLGKFFEAASKTKWFANTIFVLVADHTVPYSYDPDVTSSFVSPIDKYRIPIAYYIPSDSSFHGVDARITQQSDVLPSILWLLKYDKPFVSFGNNSFDGTSGNALYFSSGTYTYIDSTSVISFDGDNVLDCYRITPTQTVATKPDSVQIQNMKARIQEYNRRMVLNRMSEE